MFNKTLNRPMFRRGGRAGGGIMTGVNRQGYDGTDDQQLVVNNDPMKDIGKKVTDRVNIIEGLTPKYPYKGSDFFMGLGANILSQPGGQPIFQTLGTAAKDPLNLLMKQNIAEYGNKRDTVMQVFKQLSDEDKDAMINRAEAMVKADPERFPGGVKDALKVLLPTYRKDQSPQETEREDILRDEKDKNATVGNIEKTYEIGTPDAIKLYGFQKDIINDMTADAENKKYKLPYDGDQYYIENDDVTRGGKGENRLIIKDYNPEQSDYLDGTIYLDFKTNTVFVKQGQFFIPYEDYISKTISTD
jgi:hypothetical protein